MRPAGFHHSIESREKMQKSVSEQYLKGRITWNKGKHGIYSRKGIHKAELNGNWKGDELLSYEGVHGWMARNKIKPEFCENCGKKKKLELAYKDHSIGEKAKIKYRRSFSDFKWLCYLCHRTLDGRIEKLKNSHKKWVD